MSLLNLTGKYYCLERFSNSKNEELIASAKNEKISAESCTRNSTKCICIIDNLMEWDTSILNIRLVKSPNYLYQSVEGGNTKYCILHRYVIG